MFAPNQLLGKRLGSTARLGDIGETAIAAGNHRQVAKPAPPGGHCRPLLLRAGWTIRSASIKSAHRQVKPSTRTFLRLILVFADDKECRPDRLGNASKAAMVRSIPLFSNPSRFPRSINSTSATLETLARIFYGGPRGRSNWRTQAEARARHPAKTSSAAFGNNEYNVTLAVNQMY